jgi:hypothetical protein
MNVRNPRLCRASPSSPSRELREFEQRYRTKANGNAEKAVVQRDGPDLEQRLRERKVMQAELQ